MLLLSSSFVKSTSEDRPALSSSGGEGEAALREICFREDSLSPLAGRGPGRGGY
jgi:hypothetical protein